MENRPGASAPPIDESTDRVRSAADEALSEVKHAAHDVASTIKEKAGETVQNAQNKAADQTRTAATTLRDTASHLDGDLPWMKTALNKTADGFDHLTRSLDRGDIGQSLNAITDFARRQPALFLGLSVAAGFALARLGKTAVEEVQENQARSQDDQIREATAPYAPTTGL
jgi:ElaB/YqjD/DUF883 family membrane-anchored ribosome-binding protein